MEHRRPYGIAFSRLASPRRAIVVVGFLIISSVAASAQIMINKGAVISTKLNSYVQVNGAYQNQTGSIDDSGTVTITTDFTNNSAATSSNAGLYNIGGNFTNDGTFNRKTGTVNLDGTSNQNVGGAVITTFYNLKFTNGGSKTLTQKEIVDSNCYFTNGVCFTTQTDVLNFDTRGNWVNNSGMPTSGCASYVWGPCEKDMNSTNRWWFPVGEDGRANTCAITPQTSTPTTYRTQYFDSSFYNTTSVQSPLINVSTRQFWFGDITSPYRGGANAIIRLYWIPGDYVSSWMQNISGLVVARWDSAAPNPPGPTPAWMTAGESAIMPGATSDSGWIESAMVIDTQYGLDSLNRPFTLSSLTSDNSLPVEMGPFTAQQVGNAVLLHWRTYSELELRGFELDRSRTGAENDPTSTEVLGSFSDDTSLLAKNPSGAAYGMTDRNVPGSGVYAYDLFEIDRTGLRRHVGTQTVDYREFTIPTSLSVSVYPNPAGRQVRIDLDLPVASGVTLDLFDLAGRELRHVNEGELFEGPHSTTLDLSGLPDGTYTVVITAAGERAMQQIVVIQ